MFGKTMRWEVFRHNVNGDSGIVNTYSGKNRKAFTLNQNGCSRYAGISVHVEPEWVFMMGRNTQEPTATVTRPINETENATTTGFDPVSFFSGSQTETPPSETGHVDSEDQSSMPQPSTPVEELGDDEDLGKQFHTWLHDGLLKNKFETNSVNARIHRVEEGLLLVSPGIFKDFDRENWQKAQKRFQKLKLHRKTTQGTNIYTYQVTGKRSRSRIKGFLIEEPETAFEGVTFPTPNPHLKLAEQ